MRRGAALPSCSLGGKSLTSGADYHAGATESGSADTGRKTQGVDGSWWGTLWACHRFTVGVALTCDPTYRHKFLVCLRRLFLGLVAHVPLYAGESSARFSRSLSLLTPPAVNYPGQRFECDSRSHA